mmetsp:Transcript_21244/g.55445  ORF Transcript_21244/g.55445 Transcript_21244/m.55445 type:complete len:268 (-) Transcript_21244:1451-2254(-)
MPVCCLLDLTLFVFGDWGFDAWEIGIERCSSLCTVARYLLYCDTLGQIPWAVHIVPLGACHVIRQELQRNHRHNRLQTIHCLRHGQSGQIDISDLGNRIPIGIDDQRPTTTGHDLFKSVHRLRPRCISQDEHDDGHVFVNESEWAVLKLPSKNPLCVNVRQFFDLQRPFEAVCKVVATAHEEEVLLILIELCKLLAVLVKLKARANLFGQLSQCLDDLLPPFLHAHAVFAHHQAKENKHEDLRRVGLCRRHANFWAGVDMNTTFRLS